MQPLKGAYTVCIYLICSPVIHIKKCSACDGDAQVWLLGNRHHGGKTCAGSVWVLQAIPFYKADLP